MVRKGICGGSHLQWKGWWKPDAGNRRKEGRGNEERRKAESRVRGMEDERGGSKGVREEGRGSERSEGEKFNCVLFFSLPPLTLAA